MSSTTPRRERDRRTGPAGRGASRPLRRVAAAERLLMLASQANDVGTWIHTGRSARREVGAEGHYVVCLRCEASDNRPLWSLEKVRIAPVARGGGLAVRASQPGGCRVCGEAEVEVFWGAPASDALPWSPPDVRFARLRPWDNRRPLATRRW